MDTDGFNDAEEFRFSVPAVSDSYTRYDNDDNDDDDDI